MVQLSYAVLALIASGVQAAPLVKRIAQNIPEATAKWEQACLAAGGGQRCNPTSIAAFSTLLAAPGPCDQQNAADKMIDLARELKNDPTMIMLTQIFVQQPRNSPSSQSVQYCQSAPKNPELNGLFQCQFAGTNPTVFVGGVPVGQPGTMPFGRNTAVSPPGSCPANPNGPIPDGTQLVNLTQNPGVGANNSPAPASTADAATATPYATPYAMNNAANDVAVGASPATDTPTATDTPAATDASAAPASTIAAAPATTDAPVVIAAPAPAPAPAADQGFMLQNGMDAQAQNAKFATYTADTPCSEGANACVNGGFAQCMGGKFAITQCSSGLRCYALPLVNSRGTSITCTTSDDAAARIAATGAPGGVRG